MTEEHKPADFLTIGRLIEDLKSFDNQNLEVAVVLTEGGMTVPIKHLMKLTANERELALLMVERGNVIRALEISEGSEVVQ